MKLIGQTVCENCNGTGFVGYMSPIIGLEFAVSLQPLFGKPMCVSREEAIKIINSCSNRTIKMFRSLLIKNLLSTECTECNGRKIGYKLYQNEGIISE